jgi:hypothetical protein
MLLMLLLTPSAALDHGDLQTSNITDHFEHSMAEACKHAVCKQSDKDRASDFLFDFGSPKEPEKESK